MAEFPVLPLWTDALKSDTDHLTTTEFGAYLRLLITAWRTRDCRLPDDDEKLSRYARLTRGQWRKMKPILAEFFTVGNGFWTQGRLTDEHNHVRQVRESQAANGRASALKRKGRHSTEREPSESEAPTPSPSPLERNIKESSIPKKSTKPAIRYEFDGEETIMGAVRRALSECTTPTEYAAFCDPERPIVFTREEGRLVAYCSDGLAHSRVRDHEFRLSMIAKKHGFAEAWIRERPITEGDGR